MPKGSPVQLNPGLLTSASTVQHYTGTPTLELWDGLSLSALVWLHHIGRSYILSNVWSHEETFACAPGLRADHENRVLSRAFIDSNDLLSFSSSMRRLNACYGIETIGATLLQKSKALTSLQQAAKLETLRSSGSIAVQDVCDGLR